MRGEECEVVRTMACVYEGGGRGGRRFLVTKKTSVLGGSLAMLDIPPLIF